MTYTRKGLSIYHGDRLVCTAIGDFNRYYIQEAEMQRICDLLHDNPEEPEPTAEQARDMHDENLRDTEAVEKAHGDE